MRRLWLFGTLLLLVWAPWLGQAQPVTITPPVDALSGTWTVMGAEEGAPGHERRFITTAPDRIEIALEREGDDRMPVLVYRLDGAERVNPFGSGTATTRLERSAEDLILETVYIIRDRPVTVTERVRLSSSRTEMTVERTVRVEHGYLGVAPALESAAPNVSKATIVFRKQT